MAKPNYSFEKRQRELAKKKKKEEKAKEKAGRKTGDPAPEDGTDADGAAAPVPSEVQPPAP
jgi:hypothetical protein